VEYESLVGCCHEGAYICRDWELRVTERCLVEDLGVDSDASFESIKYVEIVKGLVRDRADRVIDTREVAPVTCGRTIWVLSRGTDHRGGTVFDEVEAVVWLVAAGHHRSGEPDDFFPYCKGLDAEGRILPTPDDYRRMIVERDQRVVAAIVIEAPLALQEARSVNGELRTRIVDQKLGLSIEVAGDLESITVAFNVEEVEWDLLSIILPAIQPGEWENAYKLPSRELAANECALEWLGPRSST
jgi:hypothetical protein